MSARTLERWQNLSPTYRARLERGGITPRLYLSGVSLETARGHGNEPEKIRRRQRYIAERYGAYDKYGNPYITAHELRRARGTHGERWVTDHMENLRVNYRLSARGMNPLKGDADYAAKTDTKAYEEGRNPDAIFYWYHGVFS